MVMVGGRWWVRDGGWVMGWLIGAFGSFKPVDKKVVEYILKIIKETMKALRCCLLVSKQFDATDN